MILRRLVTTFAVLGVVLGGAAALKPASAADLAVVAPADGELFVFGDRTRRGVLVRNGTLLIRRDGCWFSNVPVTSGVDYPVNVSVTYRWVDRYGNTIVSLPGAHHVALDPSRSVDLDAEGCSPYVQSYYPTISQGGLVRVISVR